MQQFYIVSESTEDTLATAHNLQDAIRMARDAVSQGQAGDLVSVLESGGQAVRQFIRMPDGTVADLPIAATIQAVAAALDPNRAAPAAAAGGRNAN
jgi:hypothetical protein